MLVKGSEGRGDDVGWKWCYEENKDRRHVDYKDN